MTDEQRKNIEDQFTNRMKNEHVKFGSKKYRELQAEFFAGAMSALHNVNKTEPSAAWSVQIMTGREIGEPYKL